MGELLRRRGMMAARSSEKPSIDEYVHDSMVLWLDAVQNTRSGHDAGAAAWEDLSGNGRDYTYDAANIINSDHFLANGRAITSSLALPTDGTIKTVELVVGFIASGSAQVFIPLGNRFGTTSIGTYNSTTPYVLFQATSGSTFTQHVFERVADADIHTYNSDGYVDGASVPVIHARAGWATVAATRLFGYSSNTSNVPACKICALRLYSRQLTAEEIAHNAALDAARFGG